MPTSTTIFDAPPSLDGPDYLALVIEWDELDGLQDQLDAEPPVIRPERSQRHPWRIGIVAGVCVLAVLALVHRMRARGLARTLQPS